MRGNIMPGPLSRRFDPIDFEYMRLWVQLSPGAHLQAMLDVCEFAWCYPGQGAPSLPRRTTRDPGLQSARGDCPWRPSVYPTSACSLISP